MTYDWDEIIPPEEQLDMFSMMVNTNQDIDGMSEEDMVSLVGSATGIAFRKDDPVFGYRMIMKKERVEFTVGFDHYVINDGRNGKKFKSCGWLRTGGAYLGADSPCDSIDEAIEFFENGKRRLGIR